MARSIGIHRPGKNAQPPCVPPASHGPRAAAPSPPSRAPLRRRPLAERRFRSTHAAGELFFPRTACSLPPHGRRAPSSPAAGKLPLPRVRQAPCGRHTLQLVYLPPWPHPPLPIYPSPLQPPVSLLVQVSRPPPHAAAQGSSPSAMPMPICDSSHFLQISRCNFCF
jgi:hypothetical protein